VPGFLVHGVKWASRLFRLGVLTLNLDVGQSAARNCQQKI
jgi:hypothetical protein